MQTVTVWDRNRQRLVIYPTLTPAVSEAEELDGLLARTALGRSVLASRPSTARTRARIAIPADVRRYLRLTALGRRVLAEDARR